MFLILEFFLSSMTWDAYRKWAHKNGLKEGKETFHHWLAERNGRSSFLPDKWKNHPLNLKPLDREQHMRLSHSYPGKRRFNAVERHWYGTPDWFKAAEVGALNRAGTTNWTEEDKDGRR